MPHVFLKRRFLYNHSLHGALTKLINKPVGCFIKNKVSLSCIESNNTNTQVFTSWIDGLLSDYNSAFYYQPRDYIAECYRQKMVLDG